MYRKGDRVRCIRKYMHGIRVGETGTVVSTDYGNLMVRWDDYSAVKHDCSGLCENGHGWNLPPEYVEFEIFPLDLGELPMLDIASIL